MEYIYGGLIGAVILYVCNTVRNFLAARFSTTQPKFEAVESEPERRERFVGLTPAKQNSDERHVEFLHDLIKHLLEKQNVSLHKPETLEKKV